MEAAIFILICKCAVGRSGRESAVEQRCDNAEGVTRWEELELGRAIKKPYVKGLFCAGADGVEARSAGPKSYW